jgi:hypothetical protein
MDSKNNNCTNSNHQCPHLNTFSEGGNKQKLTKIKQQLNLRDKQIRENVWKENTKDLLLLENAIEAVRPLS